MATSMYAAIKKHFDFPHKEARYHKGGVLMCHTAGARGGFGDEIWRKGNEYGRCDGSGKAARDAIYTKAKPHASDYGKHDKAHFISGSVLLPQLGLCFGFKEDSKITGFLYLQSHYVGPDGSPGDGFAWAVSPGSGLMKALPRLGRYPLPDLDRFWSCFKQGKLVEMTERVAKGSFVSKRPEGFVYRVDGEYYANTISRPEVVASPRSWFEKNGRYPESAALTLGLNVLSIRARA